jgi:hypothetical protein
LPFFWHPTIPNVSAMDTTARRIEKEDTLLILLIKVFLRT